LFVLTDTRGSEHPSRTAFVFYYMSAWSLPLALINRLMDRDVLYVHARGLVRKAWLRELLNTANIRLFDFRCYPEIDWARRVQLPGELADRIMGAMPDTVTAGLLAIFHDDCVSPERVTLKKLRICLFQEFVDRVQATADIETISRLLRGNYREVLALYPTHVGLFTALQNELSFQQSFFSVVQVLSESLHFVSGTATAAFRALVRRARLSKSAEVADIAGPRMKSDLRPGVVYFPHQGMMYGNLFRKDYLYEACSNSPLHPRHVLHVEEAPSASIVDQYRRAEVPWRIISPTANHLRSAARFFIRCSALRELGELRWPFFLLLLTAGFDVFRRYRAYVQAADFPPGSVAVIGYDYLFPRPLALALQACGLQLVAAQERMLTAYFKDFNIIVDRYLVGGPAVAKQIADNPFCAVSQIDCTGLWRSDFLSGPKRPKRDRTFVLVLDYHSPRNWWEDIYPLTSRTANKAFYLDIIRLAIDRPDVDFLVRGKNIDWLDDPFFADVAAMIDFVPNLDIDRTYSELNRSYNLAAEADCVVAKHTSLGDECLAVGKPVIFHDWSKNSVGYAKSFNAYAELPVFACNYGSLLDLLDRALVPLQQKVIDPRLSDIETVFVRPAPGYSVQEQARAAIKECLAPTRAAVPIARVATGGV
jgi:hypothetical protein